MTQENDVWPMRRRSQEKHSTGDAEASFPRVEKLMSDTGKVVHLGQDGLAGRSS